MGLDRFASQLRRHRSAVVLASLLTACAGVALLLDRPKGGILEWLGIPFVVVGGAAFTWCVWPTEPRLTGLKPTLANRFLSWSTWDGRLVQLFPAFGVATVLADLLYNIFLSATPALQTEDAIVLLGGFTLIGYRFAPIRFERERDFVLVFSIALNAILVVPLLGARAYYADFNRSVDVYSWAALAPQTSAVLSLLGVSNSVHAVAGATAPGLSFTPRQIPVQVTVVITTACSGIYSVGIFASAFISFILTEYERPSPRVWLLLFFGFLAAYVANVLRMVVIVLVGYYTDTPQTDLQNMLVAHSYAGWLIFLGWVSLFWWGVFKILPLDSDQTRSGLGREPVTQIEARCRFCSGSLTPVVPATRCDCGVYYHRACSESADQCISCGRRLLGTVA